MNHQTIGLFAQPVTRVDIDVNGVAQFFDTVIKSNGGSHNKCGAGSIGDEGLIHFHNHDNVFALYDELKDLGENIRNAANFVYQDVMNHKSELDFTNAWFNECQVGSSQFMHTHSNSVLSGTLYIRADENTNIQFQRPGASEVSCVLSDEPDTERDNKYGYNFHWHSCTFAVEKGICLFWPSYMKHGYVDNLTPNRLSLSFNMMPKSFNSMYNPFLSQ